MGREVKRVPLDFDHPLNEVWTGYLMPDDLRLPQCGTCGGYGRNSAFQWLSDMAYLLLMLGRDGMDSRRGQPLHPWLQGIHTYATSRPHPESMAALTGGLAGRAPRDPFGHDACDQWAATKAIITAAGLDPDTWALCETCGGKGDVATDDQRAAHEAWELTEPPEGEGYQLWETVSEGSPISPVFPTPRGLAVWMSHNDCTVNGPVPVDAALRFIDAGWAPSGAAVGGRFMDGVTFVAGGGS